MKCLYCLSQCIKKGEIKNAQRYQCKVCGKTQQKHYVKPRIDAEKHQWMQKLNNEGCGISSISRLLSISRSSVQRLIERIASTLRLPVYDKANQNYKIDELRTHFSSKRNECRLMYSQ